MGLEMQPHHTHTSNVMETRSNDHSSTINESLNDAYDSLKIVINSIHLLGYNYA